MRFWRSTMLIPSWAWRWSLWRLQPASSSWKATAQGQCFSLSPNTLLDCSAFHRSWGWKLSSRPARTPWICVWTTRNSACSTYTSHRYTRCFHLFVSQILKWHFHRQSALVVTGFCSVSLSVAAINAEMNTDTHSFTLECNTLFTQRVRACFVRKYSDFRQNYNRENVTVVVFVSARAPPWWGDWSSGAAAAESGPPSSPAADH